MATKDKYIVIDNDIIIHFIKSGKLSDIHKIFSPIKLVLLDKVYEDFDDYQGNKRPIENLISFKLVTYAKISDYGIDVEKEYLHIKKYMLKGDGETACMAVARYNSNAIIGSSNLADINQYCKMHNLNYLSTMDFLCHAREKGIFSNADCNDFIKIVLQKKSKLPVTCMEDYSCRTLSFLT